MISLWQRAVAVSALCGFVVGSFPATAQTTTCKIDYPQDVPTYGPGGWMVMVSEGAVVSYGDMKVRFTQVDYAWSTDKNSAVIDVKIPDSTSTVALKAGEPKRFIACGVEVTFVLGTSIDGQTFRVSVF